MCIRDRCNPIKALSGEVVDAVVVGGIGKGAIIKLNSMGIKVYKAIEGLSLIHIFVCWHCISLVQISKCSS